MTIRSISSQYQTPASLFEGMVAVVHHLPRWISIAIGILLIALPFAIAAFEGQLQVVLRSGEWRSVIESTAVCIYALGVAPIMLRSQSKIVESMRTVVRLSDHEYDALVAKAGRVTPKSEIVAIGIGVAIGFVVSRPLTVLMEPSILRIYLFVMVLVQFGLMSWWVFIAYANSRITTTLLRQPLQVDIFDLAPFEPIGRQSLLLAILWVGGFTISIVIGYAREAFFSWQTLVVYVLFVALAAVLFALNMRPTHKCLANTKRQELDEVARQITRSYRLLKEKSAQHEESLTASADVNAWIAMEHRLKLARTWPYNTEMLRTLVISTLVPLAAGLSKLAGALIASGRL